MSHNTLGNGEWLYPGQCLVSPDGDTQLRMQLDGKLAIYWDNKCRYQSSAEQVWEVKGLKMQDDGNLVIYDNRENPIWSTRTVLRSGGDKVVLTVQNDGNAVLYQGEAVWGSGSVRNN